VVGGSGGESPALNFLAALSRRWHLGDEARALLHPALSKGTCSHSCTGSLHGPGTGWHEDQIGKSPGAGLQNNQEGMGAVAGVLAAAHSVFPGCSLVSGQVTKHYVTQSKVDQKDVQAGTIHWKLTFHGLVTTGHQEGGKNEVSSRSENYCSRYFSCPRVAPRHSWGLTTSTRWSNPGRYGAS